MLGVFPDTGYEQAELALASGDRLVFYTDGITESRNTDGDEYGEERLTARLDELSLGLAPIIVERLLPVVRKYAVDSGCAVLLVEQHVQLALEIADRGYVMETGRIVHTGTGRALLEDPAVKQAYLGIAP